MPQRCQVCMHSDLPAIDEALIAGDSHSALAARFEVSRFSLRRHLANHVPVLLAEAARSKLFSRAESLTERLELLTDEAQSIKAKAEAGGDLRTALAAVRELVRMVELLGRFQGDLEDAPAIRITVVPEWQIVLRVLDSFPEARLALAAALEDGP